MKGKHDLEKVRRSLESAGREFSMCADLLSALAEKTPRLAGATRAALETISDRLHNAATGIGVELRDLQPGPARSWLAIGAYCATATFNIIATGALEEVGGIGVTALLDRATLVSTAVDEAETQISALSDPSDIDAEDWVTLPGDQVAVNIKTSAVRFDGGDVVDLGVEEREVLMLLVNSYRLAIELSNADWRRLEPSINRLTRWLELRGSSHSVTVDIRDDSGMEVVFIHWQRTRRQS